MQGGNVLIPTGTSLDPRHYPPRHYGYMIVVMWRIGSGIENSQSRPLDRAHHLINRHTVHMTVRECYLC